MKFPFSWLKAPLDTDAGVGAIAETLTDIGLEVESVEDQGARLRDFIVAQVISAEKHPNADKLKVCMVDVGPASSSEAVGQTKKASSSEAVGQKNNAPVQVVCGAPNAHAGMKAVFARPGVVIPASGEVLKVGTIRGVESRGMLCSGRELLLSDDHDGIIELAADARVGAPVAEALGLTDAIIEVAITPNRGDATCVYGIARDLAAAGMGRLREGDLSPVAGRFASPVRTSIAPDAEKACPIFAGRYIRGVKNGPSPQWLQDWLKAAGLRPISALVDITNFLSLDRGRPLHVFDAAKLKGDLCARFARDGEQLLALDGKTYTLDPEMLVIADADAALSIAGVMGGEATGCTEATTDVFVESAFFDPVSVARTGRILGILSDARYRFERGVDPQFVLPGLELATKMILQFCGGEPGEVVVAGEQPARAQPIAFPLSAVKRLTGLELPRETVVRILTALGFAVEGDDPLSVTPPSWRSDIFGAADLVEEVVRIHGLSHVPSVPMAQPHAIAQPVLTQAQRRTRILRRTLAARGFNETISFSFVPRPHAALFGGGDEARELENPIAADLDAMRPTPLPSLLAAAARNQARGAGDLMLFEIGAGFTGGIPGAQTTVAAGIRLGGPRRDWAKSTHAADAFDAKADMLAALQAAIGTAPTAPVQPSAPGWYHPGRSGTLALGPKILGHFGELHPSVIAAFDLKGPVAAFEIFLDAIPDSKAKKTRPAFTPSPYQAVERDFAFVVDETIAADEVLRAAKSADRNLIESASLFDVYAGKGVPEGKKSLAISVRLEPRDRTLTDAEIEAIAGKIVAAVAKATGAALRT